MKSITAMPVIAAIAGGVVAEVMPLPPPVIVVRDLRGDEKPVSVETAVETVADNGLVRRVRTSFTFTNPNSRVMQGEFEFPIPDGATVCAYELEVNGLMVPGVICEKEKVRVAFETEVKKGVDPGLVEQVKGNIWKTRIFPLNPNTPRKAAVEYVVPVTDGDELTIYEKDGDDIFVGVRSLADAKTPTDPVEAFAEGVILWDASGSAEPFAAAWREKLNALPDGGCWRLVAFRNVPEDLGEFGKADLLAKIDSLVYDGGTDIGKAVALAGRSPALLFSDEMDTLALAVPRYDDMPNVAVASRPAKPDRSVKICRLANGESVPDGVEVKVGTLLATQWAAERAKDLSSQAESRRDEFLALGRKYGVASDVTSLIVLESLDQYITHKIEPPASMAFHDEWVRRMAAKDSQIENAEADAEHARDLLALWKERVEWWNNPVPPKRTPSSGLFENLRGSNRVSDGMAAPMAAAGAPDEDGAVVHEEEVGWFDASEQLPAAPVASMMRDDRVEMAISSPVRMRSMAGSRTPGMVGAAAKAAPARNQAGGGGATISITAWKSDATYLKAIEKASDPYAEYLVQKKENGTSPAFYMDCAGFFFNLAKTDAQGNSQFSTLNSQLGSRILSNMAEFRLEDAKIWRSMGWRLREAGCLDAAIICFRHAMRLRGEEGQSRRDLALVLAEYGKATKDVYSLAEAMQLLKDAAFTDWARRSGRRSNDRQVSIIALEELNALIAWCQETGLDVAIPQFDSVYRRDLPVKIRIVLSWDADETDIDLHVLEPDGEEAYYGHRRTSSGGFVSEDVTTGYGPEEYLRKEATGKFKILTNYFASHQTALTGPATVTATVYTDWATAAEKQQIITMRLDKPKSKVFIGEVDVAE